MSLEVVNFGMDTHDLIVKGTKPGSKALRFKQLDPRGRTERTLRLTARSLCLVVLPRRPQGARHEDDARRAKVAVQVSRTNGTINREMAEIPTYKGRFGHAEAERLLWRAGFGPRRGQAASLANLGLDGAVRSLTHPPGERWVGPPPRDEKGRPLAPADAWGHDHLWWLDRMVRTSRPLVERMTLVWHDWFATSNSGVGSQKMMLAQNRLLRRYALGNFDRLLVSLTANPAMLDLALRHRQPQGRPERELRPRAHGAVHARRRATATPNATCASRPARSPAGRAPGSAARARPTFASTRSAMTPAMKTVFGKKGAFAWRDSVRLCVNHPKHAHVLRREALELLHSRAPRRTDEGGPGSDLPQGLRGPARARRDPPASRRCTTVRAW